MTPPTDHAALRRLAEAANTKAVPLQLAAIEQGNHVAHLVGPRLRVVVDRQEDYGDAVPLAEFYLRASPLVVLALLEEIEQVKDNQHPSRHSDAPKACPRPSWAPQKPTRRVRASRETCEGSKNS